MQRKNTLSTLSFIVLWIPIPTSTSTPKATATNTAAPTKTAIPTATPKPTITPNLAATQHMSDLQAEAQTYFDQGYIASADGKFMEYDDLMRNGPN